MTLRVAIVGAGCSGLSAAVTLAAAGCAVTVFESARQPGGRARSVELGGNVLDNGQHLLSGAYSCTLALLKQIGVKADQVLLRLPLDVLVPGRFHLRLPRLPAPLHLAFGLLGAQGVSFAGKLAAARFMRRLQAGNYRLPGDLPVAAWLDANDQKGALRRHLWESICLAALNTPPERASAQVFANVLRDTLGGARTATDLLVPRVDLGRLLPEPALDFLRAHCAQIRMPARVRAFADNADGIEVIGDDFRACFDRVVLACAPQHLAALLPNDDAFAGLRACAGGFDYEPIGTVFARYPASVRLPLPLLALDSGPAQWVFDRGALGGPPGLLAHVLSATGDWAALDNAALAAALHDELHSAFPATPPMQGFDIIRERRATFACAPNLNRPANATPWPALWLAGDYTVGDYPATIEGAIRSGIAAARGILR